MALRSLRIVIPGGTGHLGTVLARHFHREGHSVVVIGRKPAIAPWQTVPWTANTLGPWVSAIDGADVVINLAGRSVNCRYNSANRREILNSRTITTGLVGEAIAQSARPPFVWLNASTATIYRHSLDRALDDRSGELGGKESGVPSSWAFSVEVANSWERALFAANTPATRRVALRSGLVMIPEVGGVFDVLLRLVRFGLGGTAASGNQFVSWVHDVDFIRAVEFVIEAQSLTGPVNICSPCPVPNKYFMRCLRHAWCTMYVGLPAPEWLLSIGAMLLNTETELVLKSRRVVPGRMLAAGFEFHFPNWRGASQDLVDRWRKSMEDAH